MFEQVDRCHYEKSPLLEVICQLRFPTILSISEKEPAEFQESVRAAFPVYQKHQDQPAPKVAGMGTANPTVQTQPPVTNYHFISEDGRWRLNLTNSFIALTCRRYDSWEEFARMLDQALASFIRIYEPAYFERVGLRYMNAISRRELGLEGISWKDLLSPAVLGMLAEEDVQEQSVGRCTMDVDMALAGGCRLKMRSAPGMIRRAGQPEDKETRWILDIDLSTGGKVPVNQSAPALQMLHMHATPIFRNAITDQLHAAMEPAAL